MKHSRAVLAILGALAAGTAEADDSLLRAEVPPQVRNAAHAAAMVRVEDPPFNHWYSGTVIEVSPGSAIVAANPGAHVVGLTANFNDELPVSIIIDTGQGGLQTADATVAWARSAEGLRLYTIEHHGVSMIPLAKGVRLAEGELLFVAGFAFRSATSYLPRESWYPSLLPVTFRGFEKDRHGDTYLRMEGIVDPGFVGGPVINMSGLIVGVVAAVVDHEPALSAYSAASFAQHLQPRLEIVGISRVPRSDAEGGPVFQVALEIFDPRRQLLQVEVLGAVVGSPGIPSGGITAARASALPSADVISNVDMSQPGSTQPEPVRTRLDFNRTMPDGLRLGFQIRAVTRSGEITYSKVRELRHSGG